MSKASQILSAYPYGTDNDRINDDRTEMTLIITMPYETWDLCKETHGR